ncbi:hypothetical protein BJ165DRAFT_1487334 [Panaeolus papilionaceus]|nr:hypothetical protein BJ165DRAFT_1487334 [Panaeolus papilionaceus]
MTSFPTQCHVPRSDQRPFTLHRPWSKFPRCSLHLIIVHLSSTLVPQMDGNWMDFGGVWIWRANVCCGLGIGGVKLSALELWLISSKTVSAMSPILHELQPLQPELKTCAHLSQSPSHYPSNLSQISNTSSSSPPGCCDLKNKSLIDEYNQLGLTTMSESDKPCDQT